MNTLTEQQIKQLQAKIDLKPLSFCYLEVKDIIGDEWELISNRYEYGKQFRHAVESGRIKNLRYCGRKSDNHCKYFVIR